jgi:nitrite reductase (NADH) small subunit
MSTKTGHIVADASEIPEGDVIGVEVDGLEIAVFNIKGDFYAMQNRCVHRNAPLHKIYENRINEEDCMTEGPGDINQESCTISCPWHGWSFDLKTGKNPASKKGMRTFEVERDNGDIVIYL